MAGDESGSQSSGDLGFGRQEYRQTQPFSHELNDSSIFGYSSRHSEWRIYPDALHHGCDPVHDGLANPKENLVPFFSARYVRNDFRLRENCARAAYRHRFRGAQSARAQLFQRDLQCSGHGFEKAAGSGGKPVPRRPNWA